MSMNYLAILGAALVPMFVGFLWYSKFLFGNVWQREVGLSDEDIESGNMALIFGVSLILAIMLSFGLTSWSIHQMSTQSLFVTQAEYQDTSSAMYKFVQDFMTEYGHLHRTFGHGVVHGVVAGLFIAFPIIGTKALFERKSWKYILINASYWTVTLALMCGIICQFL